MSSSVPARTVIIDDDERARNLLNEIISLRADVEVVGSVANRGEAVERLLATHPDLLANVLALAELIRELTQSGPYARYLPVKVRERIILRKVDDVSWFEAHGKYVQLHTGDGSQVIRHPMHSLESRLNPAKFIRVSRWAIINIDHVNYLEPWSNGEWAITMRTGQRVISTESYRKGLQSLLKAG
jgi:two-component system LytT family response regulator